MKRCPRCNRIYSENDLNFCLDDGELLSHYSGEEPTRSLHDETPPTIQMDLPRVTDPIGWPVGQPVSTWQPVGPPRSHYNGVTMPGSPSQTLAILSLGLGAVSLVIGWCCSNGLLLAPASIIIGIVALMQIKKDPRSYGGRGFAYAGIACGGAFLLLYLLFVILYGFFALFGGALQSI